MKFYGELGCGLETNLLHFGDDPHHYPYPGVRSSGKNCHIVNTQNRCPTKIIQQFYYAGVRRRSVLSEYYCNEIHYIVLYCYNSCVFLQ